MEENRLKPMVEGYDVKVFNQIYKDTEALRKKLAGGIDAKRFGVDYYEVLSWFDVKFIHTFNKYYEKHNPDVLKGHIISALSRFKYRVMRAAYTQKNQVNNTVDLMDYSNQITVDNDFDETPKKIKIALTFIKEKVSQEAYQILTIDINPPYYILNKLAENPKYTNTKIPNHLIAEYIGLGNDINSVKYIKGLRQEIELAYEELGSN